MSDCDPWAVGAIRVRRIRGPREDGRVYWRAVIPGRDEEPKCWCLREDPAWSAELPAIARGEERTRTHPEVVRMLELLGRFNADLDARVEAGEIKPRSRTTYRQALRYLAHALADVPVHAMDVDVIRSYARDRRAGTVRPAVRAKGGPAGPRFVASPQTLAGEIDVLRAAWMWGRKRGIVDRPLDVPRMPQPKAVRTKYTPSIEEVEAVIAELRQPWERAVVEVLLATGARIGEVASLTWERARDGALVLDGKTGPREVPILEDVADVLERLGPPTEGRIWPVARDTIRFQLRASIADACERLGLQRWTPHGLRRLAVDRLYARYGDVSVVAALLGQSPVVALRYYRQPSREALTAALRAAGMGQRGKVLRMVRS